uniref:Uncharacterized protein n=1 Tax=Romanomermis culicivorax TaxID=13658 RepID=A0A915K6A9_ROMCU
MWRCLRFEKRKHALEKRWLGWRCHFDRPILATGSGYDSGIRIGVVCGSQSSGQLWCSRSPPKGIIGFECDRIHSPA